MNPSQPKNEEPKCVEKLPIYLSKDISYIKLFIKWWQASGYSHDKIKEFIETLCIVHKLEDKFDEILNYVKELENKTLCEVAKELGLCENCGAMWKPPIQQLIDDLRPVVLNYTTGTVVFYIKNKKFEYKLSDFYHLKKGKYAYNHALFFNMYLLTYLKPCNPSDITDEDIEKFLNALLDGAEVVKAPDEEDLILENVVETLLDLNIKPFSEDTFTDINIGNSIFIDEKKNKVIVKASLIYQRLNSFSEKKIVKALLPYLIKESHSATKVMKYLNTYYDEKSPARFFIFSLTALKRLIEEITGEPWEIKYTPDEDIEVVKSAYQELIKKRDEEEQDLQEKDSEEEEVKVENKEDKVENIKEEKGAEFENMVQKAKKEVLETIMSLGKVTYLELEELLGYPSNVLQEALARLSFDGEIYEPKPGVYTIL